MSIHNQESEEEAKFFYGEKSGFDKLYEALNVDVSFFNSPGQSSLKNYGNLLSSGSSILVHNTFTKKEDLDFVKNKQIFWCFCPSANYYIENSLPDFSLFKDLKNKICIGTDSLASNTQLDLIVELNQIIEASRMFTEENLLAMLTYNGAKALGIENRFGQFIIGQNCGLNLINFNNSVFSFTKKIY